MIQKAVKGLSYLLLMKLFAKVLDFTLNTLVIRGIDENTLGLTMHYNLLFGSCMFLVKLCFKTTYLKRSIQNLEGNITPEKLLLSSRNLMVYGIYYTSILSTILYFIWDYLYGNLDKSFNAGSLAYCIAAIFVFLSSIQDCMLVKALLNFDYGVAAKSEGVALTFKNILLYILISQSIFPPLLSFGISHLCYSIVLVLSTKLFLSKENSMGSLTEIFFLKPVEEKQKLFVYSEMKETSKQMIFTSFSKFILQELEKIIMMNFSISLKTNAEYTLISNLGALIPRHFYAPVEEVCYNLFAEMGKNNQNKSKRILSSSELTILRKILLIINIIGTLLSVYGFAYSDLLLGVLYGEKGSSQVFWFGFLLIKSIIVGMQAYWIYIYVIGINGIVEAYFFSTAENSQMKPYTYFFGFSTGVYIILCYFLQDYHSLGIIFPNTITMLLRIFYCLNYMKKNLEDSSMIQFILSTLPNWKIYLYYALVLIITHITSDIVKNKLLQFAEGGILGLILLGLIYKYHFKDIVEVMKVKSKEKTT